MAKVKVKTDETTAAIPVKPKKPQVKKAKDKLNILEIAQGKLVGEVKEKVVEFFLNGQIQSVDVRIRQLPFAITDSLNKRLNKGEDVFSEWAALALVDENNKTFLTKEQIDENFIQAFANALFPVIMGLDYVEFEEDEKEGGAGK